MSLPQHIYEPFQTPNARDTSNSRRRLQHDSPRWCEEAGDGNIDPSLQLPPMPPMPPTIETLTQENFAAWLAEQKVSSVTEPADPGAPLDASEEALVGSGAIDNWLSAQAPDDASKTAELGMQHGSSSNASANTSPFTGQDYSNSPASMFAGFPATRPAMSQLQLGTSGSGSRVSLLPPSLDPPSNMVGQQPDLVTASSAQFSGQPFERDFLGIGSFTEADQQRSRVVTVRPLKYRPLTTWYHLWLT